jgi:hypothetical protein
MPSARRCPMLLALVLLLPLGATATPLITTNAVYSEGPISNPGGPVFGGGVSSLVTTPNAGQVCQFTGNCIGDGLAAATQNETVLGIFSALAVDGVFADANENAESLTARTTWAESPASDGPASIALLIKPGRLISADFNGLSATDSPTIEARFRIELTVDGNATPFFFAEAILTGGQNGLDLDEFGTDLGGTAFSDVDFPNEVRGFDFDAFAATIPLGSLTTSDVVRYVMEVGVSGPGLETGGLARIGNPFDLGSSGSSISFVPKPGLAALVAFAALAVVVRPRG